MQNSCRQNEHLSDQEGGFFAKSDVSGGGS